MATELTLAADARARLVSQWMRRTAGPRPDVGIPRADRTRDLPLSFAQERLWFLDRLEPGLAAYNVPIAIRLRGELDVPTLQRALDAVVARHETLRTTFESGPNGLHQVIQPAQGAPIRRARVEHLAEAVGLATQIARQPFDLRVGPLLRVALIQIGTANDHVLVMTLHHAICDGWSLEVLFEELTALYSDGGRCLLPRLEIQYADVAAWQREWLQGARLSTQVDDWKRQLAGAPPLLELRSDRPRPPLASYRGARHTFTVSAELATRVHALGQRLHVTPFMGLLGAYQLLLARCSGQTDVVVGSPIAARTRAETEPLIGLFVNTLALRTSVAGRPSVAEFLKRVRETCLRAYAHQDTPFELVVHALQPMRDPAYQPVFQAMFVLENTPTELLRLPGIQSTLLDIDPGTAMFDVSLYMTLQPDGSYTGVIEYATDLFDAATIVTLGRRYTRLLAAMAADDARSVPALPLLEPAELEAQLHVDRVRYPEAESTLHDVFARRAAANPAQVALKWGRNTLRFAQLDARANGLAHQLRALGVGPDVVVGVCADRSPEAILAFLAILKAGGAYLALEPGLPEHRLRQMVADARPAAILTTQPLDWCDATLRLELAGPTAATAPSIHVDAENLAYVIYTSGSTGSPRGVMTSHRAALNRCAWMWRSYPWQPDGVACHKTPLSFVDSVWEIWGALLAGTPLEILTDDVVKDPGQFVDALAAAEVTRIALVPSLLAILLECAPDLGARLPRLRSWTVSGEPLPAGLICQFFERMPDRLLLNLYGSSEVSADVTASALTEPQSIVTIGEAIANTRVLVLDTEQRLLPTGAVGELYVGGDGLARGYLGDPRLTAERFVPDPFGPLGARLYRTGDVGRLTSYGALVHLGRRDHQVKIRGCRVELGDIEAALAAHPAVQGVAVQQHGDRLVAYVVTHQDAINLADVRAFASERLPDYMLPAQYVQLDEMPRTATGKLDRRALPRPSRTVNESGAAPRTELERRIAAIWADALQLAAVGRHDNFFELGGNSLLAMRLHVRLAAEVSSDVQLLDLFRWPTISTLAAHLDPTLNGVSPAIRQPQQRRVAADQFERRDIRRQLRSQFRSKELT